MKSTSLILSNQDLAESWWSNRRIVQGVPKKFALKSFIIAIGPVITRSDEPKMCKPWLTSPCRRWLILGCSDLVMTGPMISESLRKFFWDTLCDSVVEELSQDRMKHDCRIKLTAA